MNIFIRSQVVDLDRKGSLIHTLRHNGCKIYSAFIFPLNSTHTFIFSILWKCSIYSPDCTTRCMIYCISRFNFNDPFELQKLLHFYFLAWHISSILWQLVLDPVQFRFSGISIMSHRNRRPPLWKAYYQAEVADSDKDKEFLLA